MGGKGKESSRERAKNSNDAFSEVIDVEYTDPAFYVRGHILGEKGCNMHHIQDETGAKIFLEESDAGGHHLQVTASNQEDLDKASEMLRDLLVTVFDEYDQWQADGGPDSEDGGSRKGSRRGKDKDKDSGKGKGKGKKKSSWDG